jgi:hypothetical protein
MDSELVIRHFRNWADVEAVANLSPLYAVFGHAVADDPELLDLAAQALPGQPPPNVFFGAVHALLARHKDDPLAQYYPSLGGTLAADESAADLLRDFCRERRAELLPIIRTRLTQTNEVRRSAILLPAFASVAADAGGAPLSLIEIGPSAGLNLLFDRYQYRYGGHAAGIAGSRVILDCDVQGSVPDAVIPEIAARSGIDVNPLNVRDEADVAWLKALLWPEHLDRLALLNAALEEARRDPPRLLRGNVLDLLPIELEATPPDSTVCVSATFVLNQFPSQLLTELRAQLLALSCQRRLYVVVMGFSEFIEPGTPRVGDTMVWILRLEDGHGEYRLSSLANPHGRWIDWRPNSEWKPWATKIQNPKSAIQNH